MTAVKHAAIGGIDSEILKWLVRACLPLIVTLSLGIFSWNAARVVSTLDLHNLKLEDITNHLVVVESKVTVVQQSVNALAKQRDDDSRASIAVQADHEARIRNLEKPR